MQHILIESAVKLDAKELSSLEAVLKKKVDGKFSVENVVNESILGGLRVTINGQRFDASVKGKLEQVKKSLT